MRSAYIRPWGTGLVNGGPTVRVNPAAEPIRIARCVWAEPCLALDKICPREEVGLHLKKQERPAIARRSKSRSTSGPRIRALSKKQKKSPGKPTEAPRLIFDAAPIGGDPSLRTNAVRRKRDGNHRPHQKPHYNKKKPDRTGVIRQSCEVQTNLEDHPVRADARSRVLTSLCEASAKD